jgi:hypothetical protein
LLAFEEDIPDRSERGDRESSVQEAHVDMTEEISQSVSLRHVGCTHAHRYRRAGSMAASLSDWRPLVARIFDGALNRM